ncbi:MAG: sugar phosphate isomerase/epimerase family protein [Christensenellales bacterium]
MKLSCLPVSLFQDISSGAMSVGEWFDFAAECGFDGADISMLFIHSHAHTYVQQFKRMLQSKPIPAVMCSAYPDFTHYDEQQLKREAAYFNRDIALCSELGIPFVRVLAGQAHPETDIDKGIDQAIKYIREAAKVADDYGVTLLYENHGKPGAWQYIDMTYPPELFLRVLEGIWNTSVLVNFDIGNVTAYGDDAVELLKRVYEKVGTIHVSDMKEKGTFAPTAIGTGVAPLKEAFSLLKKKGFNGWISIEEASFNGKDGICRAVEVTKKLWNEA